VSHTVVITGASGTVGRVLLRGLDERFLVRGVDRRRRGEEVPGRPVTRGDLGRASFARRALRGADTVVHLAATPSMTASWRTAHDVNMRLTWEVLEAAVANRVSRVVLASSNHVVGGYEDDEPYRTVLSGVRAGIDVATFPRLGIDVPVRPDSPYGVGKVMDEAAGRHYADAGQLSVIALRLGTVLRSDRPETPRQLSTLLSHRDLVQLVERSIEAPSDLRFGVFYGVSANRWRIWDIEGARVALDYEPVDDAEQDRPRLLAE
jgi:nucleoside-diphosphate-sugar epimerase